MEMPKHTCSYSGGMNKDLSVNQYPNTCYFDATNLRLITTDSSGLTNEAFVTPKGNAAAFTIVSDGLVIGHTILRDFLVLFVNDLGATNPDRIYKIPLTSLKTATDITVNNIYYWTAVHPQERYLVYWGDLGFHTNYPIRAVGSYENEDVQKVYWVDGLNPLRHINTIYNATYNDLANLDPELLEVLPNHTYGSYALTEGIGGHLKAGRIQYSYQLYSVSGSETMYAPPSNLYNITSHQSSDGEDFVGNDLETIINKYIQVTLTLSVDTVQTFNRIRLLALEYEEYGDIPTVRVVSERELNTTTPIFYDYGDKIGELTLEEFQIIKNSFIPKTIESKNGYLFAGNITEEIFDVDDLVEDLALPLTFLDTRAYRWRYGTGTTMSGSDTLTDATDPAAVADPETYGASAFSVSVVSLLDTGWHVHILVDAEGHATGLGRTFSSISSINGLGASLVLRGVADGLWNHGVTLDFSGAIFEYDSSGIPFISIEGTQYIGGLPSALDPSYPTNYDNDVIINFSYTYTYTYVAVGSAVDCVINKGMSNEVVIDSGGGPDFTQLQTSAGKVNDCINTYNNISNDTNVDRDHAYKYKQITAAAPPAFTDLGGTGPYISYGFTYTDINSADKTSKGAAGETLYTFNPSNTSPGYTNQQYVLNNVGLQRDEVYRYGIDFYDLKGRPSYTKWIGDIRMPDISEELDPGSTYSQVYQICYGSTTDLMVARILNIKFTIDWGSINTDYPGLLAQLSGFQIVRVLRTDGDCTIKGSGIILPTHYPNVVAGEIKDSRYSTYNIGSAEDYTSATPFQIVGINGLNSSLDQTLVDFIAPEIAFNRSLISDSNDFFEVCGYLDNIRSGGTITGDIKTYSVNSSKVTALDVTPTVLGSDCIRTINDSFISTPELRSPITHVIGATSYTARGYDDEVDGDEPCITYKGTSLIAEIASAFGNAVSPAGLVAGDCKAMYGRYRRSLGYSIYGGCTYHERSYSQYIKAGEFYPVATSGTTNYDVFGGDTYIGPFTYLKLFVDTDGEYTDRGGQVLVTFPYESRLNLSHRLDRINAYTTVPTGSSYYLAERQTLGIGQYPNTYPEVGDLYRYNSAYSAENQSKFFASKPFDYRAVDVHDNMVVSSEKKVSGEYSDSWLKFKYNNYIELDSNCGAITRLINQNDRLFSFQPRGISILSVNDRELVQTQNTGALSVGTGGVLSRYDYLTRQAGSSWYDSIIPTELGIYLYDNNSYKIYRIIDSVEPISDTKGMKSYFEVNAFTITRAFAGYDKLNREVLFSFPNLGKTLIFSAFKDCFTGFYSVYFTDSIQFDKYFLSYRSSSKYYLHDTGSYNSFYGSDVISNLTVIANPYQNKAVTFHVIEWLMDVTNSGVEVADETFTNVRITNTHQDTGTLTFPGTTGLIRRFRVWRMNLFRNSADSKRIRDSWIKAYFTYNNVASNRKAVIYPITFSWLPTKIR